LKKSEDKAVLVRLLEDADVFISNTRPQALRKLGLAYEVLEKHNPRLVFCGTYGFSEKGPYAGRPAFDDVIQAMSGLAALQGHNSSDGPEYVNTIMADKCAGLTATYAIQPARAHGRTNLQAEDVEHGLRAHSFAAPAPLPHA
jgi:crotonobetainyl-CoA:carnitine CoA-transferase CaiB-like acyl-CoA transferase